MTIIYTHELYFAIYQDIFKMEASGLQDAALKLLFQYVDWHIYNNTIWGHYIDLYRDARQSQSHGQIK